MPIIQISKIQQRSGNLVDLPQLDNAQFGWAYDQNRLFIGRSGDSVTAQNIEVLTSYSNISFSQITGTSGGNINVTTPQPGQVLSYAGSNVWLNSGGNALDTGNSSYYTSSNIHLGNVSNVYLGGGAIGYVLQTDGTGRLTWTPKTTVVANIQSLTNSTTLPDGSPGNIIIMNVSNSTPYTNGAQVTIAGVTGTNANAIVNSHVFYVKVSNNYPSSGNVFLYEDGSFTTPANGVNLTATANTGTATTAVVNTGITYAAGSNTSIQYNNGGFLDGSAMTISGSNLTLSGGNFTIGNVSATGNITANNFTGTLLTASQTNITSVGALINLSVTGNANIGNIGTAGLVTATGNVTGGNLVTAGTLVGGNLTANTVTFTNGGTSSLSAVVITTNNANGGSGFAGIMQLVNTTGGATNPNKFIRLDTTGNLQIVNSGYTSTLFSLTDAGALTILGNANTANLGTTGVFATTLSATGNANVGNLGFGTGLITGTGNANVGNVNTAIVSASGNVTGANVITSTYFIQSIQSSATATGTNQGTALAITKSIIECTTVASGTGVVLPTAVAGMSITVVNSGGNSLAVYPAVNGAINSQAANTAYSVISGARLQFFATSTTKWYTLNATYA